MRGHQPAPGRAESAPVSLPWGPHHYCPSVWNAFPLRKYLASLKLIPNSHVTSAVAFPDCPVQNTTSPTPLSLSLLQGSQWNTPQSTRLSLRTVTVFYLLPSWFLSSPQKSSSHLSFIHPVVNSHDEQSYCPAYCQNVQYYKKLKYRP